MELESIPNTPVGKASEWQRTIHSQKTNQMMMMMMIDDDTEDECSVGHQPLTMTDGQ